MLVHLLTRSRAVLWILMHPFRGKSGSRACGARWTGLRADDQTERERDSANCSLADATGSSADAVRVRSSSCVDLAALESKVRTIREYQPAMVPGILQTPAYTRDMLSIPGGAVLTGATPSSIESLVAERVKRQEVLYQPGRHIQVVLGEPALWTYFDTIDTLRGQLDRLVTLSGLASVELGVLRIAQPSPAMPLSGFSIHDEDVVFVETLTGEQRLEDPSEVLAYLKMFDLLREAAATGPEAIALIQNALAQLNN